MTTICANSVARAHGSRAYDVADPAVEELIRPVDLIAELPITRGIAEFIRDVRSSIGRILRGDDPRLLLVVGPCSAHDARGTLEYATWIRERLHALADYLLVVMRVYFEKPRTRDGWKGFISDPHLDGSCRINDGLREARQLLLAINAMGVPTGTEFVNPITPHYIGDLVSWAAIGARTAESPIHRELASGLSCPVGFKNGTTGEISVAVNAVLAARRAHRCLGMTGAGRAAIVSTKGNPDCHVILRGGVRPNYDEASVSEVAALLASKDACPRVMVDCSHGNCQRDYRRQLLVAAEIARQRQAGSEHICGLMVESHLIGGCQRLVPEWTPVRGLSVTDPCLGIEDTITLLNTLVGAGPSARASESLS